MTKLVGTEAGRSAGRLDHPRASNPNNPLTNVIGATLRAEVEGGASATVRFASGRYMGAQTLRRPYRERCRRTLRTALTSRFAATPRTAQSTALRAVPFPVPSVLLRTTPLYPVGSDTNRGGVSGSEAHSLPGANSYLYPVLQARLWRRLSMNSSPPSMSPCNDLVVVNRPWSMMRRSGRPCGRPWWANHGRNE